MRAHYPCLGRWGRSVRLEVRGLILPNEAAFKELDMLGVIRGLNSAFALIQLFQRIAITGDRQISA